MVHTILGVEDRDGLRAGYKQSFDFIISSLEAEGEVEKDSFVFEVLDAPTVLVARLHREKPETPYSVVSDFDMSKSDRDKSVREVSALSEYGVARKTLPDLFKNCALITVYSAFELARIAESSPHYAEWMDWMKRDPASAAPLLYLHKSGDDVRDALILVNLSRAAKQGVDSEGLAATRQRFNEYASALEIATIDNCNKRRKTTYLDPLFLHSK